MRFVVNGSGVRRTEIELTDCELKDLAYCIQQMCAQGFSGKTSYGCTELEILDDANAVRLQASAE